MLISVVDGQSSWFDKLLSDYGFEIRTGQVGDINSAWVLSIPVSEIEFAGMKKQVFRCRFLFKLP